jgi:BolA family transcriptional regulator, general stress-responsive regulator
MNTNEKRCELIKEKLISAFAPQRIKVINESHLHIGHAGAKTGKGHFALTISADAFTNKKPLECHRLIYAALGELMQTDIHALRIKVIN